MMGVCGGFIFCASNIYSGKHDNSIPVAKNPFKILVHVPHLEAHTLNITESFLMTENLAMP